MFSSNILAQKRNTRYNSISYDMAYEGFYWTVKKIKGHKCSLVEEVEPITKFIESGWCVPFRRWLKKFTTISENDPITKSHLKSLYRIRLENIRHLERFFYMIHPFSDGLFYWNTFMLAVFVIQLISVPLLIISSKTMTVAPDGWIPFLRTLNIFCICDIIIHFLCGYYDKKEQIIVLEPKLVAKKYLKTHFLFDLLTVCQLNYFAVFYGLFEPNWIYNIQWILRFSRIGTISPYSIIYGIRWNIPRYIIRTTAYMIIATIFFVWMLLLIHMVDYWVNGERNIDMHFHTLIALELLENIFLVKVRTPNEGHRWYELAIYLGLLYAGFFFTMFVAAQILQIFICHNISKNKYDNLLSQIKAYTRYKQVPQRVNRRIERYVEFKFQKTIFKEKTILDSLSNSLKNEIVWRLCQNIVTRVEIFKDMPPDMMMKIVMLLKQEIFLPNDVVVQTGETGTEMFFIYVGVLAVYAPTGREICHLTDGDHFGEIALLLNETRVASVVAIDFCELYRLTKNDFNEALEAYPAARMRILQLGQNRLEETQSLNREPVNA